MSLPFKHTQDTLLNNNLTDRTAFTSRNSSFELLRLVLMVLIIIHHCIVHGLKLGQVDSFINENKFPVAYGLNAFCICAVNCFILISGYFKIKTSSKKFLYLLLTLLFYVIVFKAIPNAIVGNWKSVVGSVLFVSHTPYWFVIDYLFLMVFTPMINLAFETFRKRQRWLITIGLLIISCYFGFIWGHEANQHGYTIIQFITMYCVGREICLSKISITKRTSFAIYCISGLCIGILGCYLHSIGKHSFAWELTYYNDPLTIIESVGLFFIFKNISFSSLKINRLAKSAFGIYLFQESPFISSLLYGGINEIAPTSGMSIYPLIFIIALITAGVAILFDQLRLISVSYTEGKIYRLYEKKISKHHDTFH